MAERREIFTPPANARIAAAVRQVEGTSPSAAGAGGVGEGPRPDDRIFPALLTGGDASIGFDWDEASAADTEGGFSAKTGGRNSADNGVAFEDNGLEVTEFPLVVRMHQRRAPNNPAGDEQWAYGFSALGVSADCGYPVEEEVSFFTIYRTRLSGGCFVEDAIPMTIDWCLRTVGAGTPVTTEIICLTTCPP